MALGSIRKTGGRRGLGMARIPLPLGAMRVVLSIVKQFYIGYTHSARGNYIVILHLR